MKLQINDSATVTEPKNMGINLKQKAKSCFISTQPSLHDMYLVPLKTYFLPTVQILFSLWPQIPCSAGCKLRQNPKNSEHHLLRQPGNTFNQNVVDWGLYNIQMITFELDSVFWPMGTYLPKSQHVVIEQLLPDLMTYCKYVVSPNPC